MTSESPDVWAQLDAQAQTEIARRRASAEHGFVEERHRIAEKMATDQTLNSGALVGAVVQSTRQTFSTFAQVATGDLIELVEIRFEQVTEEGAAWIRRAFEQLVEPMAYSLVTTLQEFGQARNVSLPFVNSFDLITSARQDRDIRLGRLLLRKRDMPSAPPLSSPRTEVGEPARAENPRSVFVVHGRNEAARKAMFGFLRAIGLEPMEWSEAVASTGSATPYIGEVLDAAFQRAQAVVVLFTGDDVARLGTAFVTSSDPVHEKQLTPQARPNVLFEAGMALGRHPKRTVLASLGETRPFSDVAGRYTIRLTNSPKSRNELVSRLRTAGCDVANLHDRTDWLEEGDFEDAVREPDTPNPQDGENDSSRTFHGAESFARQTKLLLGEIERNKALTGRATSNPAHRHLDATIELAERDRLDEQNSQLMAALHELKKRTDEQQSLHGYQVASRQFTQHYIPAAESVERELASRAGSEPGNEQAFVEPPTLGTKMKQLSDELLEWVQGHDGLIDQNEFQQRFATRIRLLADKAARDHAEGDAMLSAQPSSGGGVRNIAQALANVAQRVP